MKEALITILESIEITEGVTYPAFLQGSLADDAPYPESFFTFWNGDTDDNDFYNNQAVETVWEFDVNFYSVDPVLVEEMILRAKQALIDAGWIVNGKGYDLPVDEPTHTGRSILAIFRENEN